MQRGRSGVVPSNATPLATRAKRAHSYYLSDFRMSSTKVQEEIETVLRNSNYEGLGWRITGERSNANGYLVHRSNDDTCRRK